MFEFIGNDSMKFVPKSWGYELWIVNVDKYCGKILFIKKGQYLSYHFHKLKDEVLFLQTGKARFVISDKPDGSSPRERTLIAGDAYRIGPGCPHQIEALEDTTIIEISTEHFDSDSYRLSKSKGEGGSRIEVTHSKPDFSQFDGQPNSVPESWHPALQGR